MQMIVKAPKAKHAAFIIILWEAVSYISPKHKVVGKHFDHLCFSTLRMVDSMYISMLLSKLKLHMNSKWLIKRQTIKGNKILFAVLIRHVWQHSTLTYYGYLKSFLIREGFVPVGPPSSGADILVIQRVRVQWPRVHHSRLHIYNNHKYTNIGFKEKSILHNFCVFVENWLTHLISQTKQRSTS